MKPNTKEKQKRMAISYALKKEICLFKQRNPNKTQNKIKDECNSKYQLNLDRSTISKILSDKEKQINFTVNETINNTFHKSRVKHPDLEKALNIWVNQAVASGLSISENLLCEKARYYAMVMNISVEDIKFSNRWLSGFKQRNNLKVHKIHREANTAPIELLLNM